MELFFLRFLLLACCLGGSAVALTGVLREQLFHSVEAICLSGEWVHGGTKRGYALLHLQYVWNGTILETIRTYQPLDSSPRLVTTPEDVKRGHDWIAAECRPQPVWIMHGQPSLAWFRDNDWFSVMVNVVLRCLLLAAIFAGAWTLVKRRG